MSELLWKRSVRLEIPLGIWVFRVLILVFELYVQRDCSNRLSSGVLLTIGYELDDNQCG